VNLQIGASEHPSYCTAGKFTGILSVPAGTKLTPPHNAAVANCAPSARERSLAQAICGCVRPPKPQIRSCDYILLAQQRGESLNALRYQLRVFHNICGMRDHAGNENLARGQLDRFPDSVFVLVPRVGCFNQVGLRLPPIKVSSTSTSPPKLPPVSSSCMASRMR